MIDTLILGGIFTSLLAGQFARIELINSLANVYIHEFLLVVFILYSMYRQGLVPLRVFLRVKGVLIFLLIVLFSFALSYSEYSFNQNVISLLYLVRMILYSVFGVYLFALLKQNKNARTTAFQLIYTFSILLLVVTSIQYVFFPNFWELYKLGWDPHLYRASAIYLDVFIAAALYGILAIFWYGKKNYLLTCCFVLALILSLSRSSYIAFAVSIIFYFMSRMKWKNLFIALSVFILVIILMPKPFGEGGNLLRTASINSRILDYKLGISLWQEKPLFGFGYNRIRFAKEQHGLAVRDDRSHSLASFHSSFLIILVSTGLIGFAAYLFLLIRLFRSYANLRVYLVYLIIMSLFDNIALHVLVLLPFMFLAAHEYYSSLE